MLSDDLQIASAFNKLVILIAELMMIVPGIILITASKREAVNRAVRVGLGYGWKIIIGIVIVELIFGGWFSPLNRLKNLNIPRAAQMQYDVSSLYPSDGLITYTRDKYGLRGSYPTPADIDILTVGGSTTDCSMITDDRTWQAYLAADFAADGDSISVVNAGRNGQSTVGNIKCFQVWFPLIPKFKPKYILFYIGENDLTGGEVESDNFVAKRGFVGSIVVAITTTSFLFTPLHTLYRKLKHDHGIAANKAVMPSDKNWTVNPMIPEVRYDSLMAPHLKSFEKRVSLLLDYTESLGAIPILVSHPTRKWRFVAGMLEGIDDSAKFGGVSYNGVDKYYMMERQNSVMEQLAKSRGGVYIPAGSYTSWEDDDFYDLVHFTPKGCTKFARMLFEALRPVVRKRQG